MAQAGLLTRPLPVPSHNECVAVVHDAELLTGSQLPEQSRTYTEFPFKALCLRHDGHLSRDKCTSKIQNGFLFDWKSLNGLVVSRLKGQRIEAVIQFKLRSKAQKLLRRHIPGQIVFGHGAAAKTLNSPIKATATGIPSSVNLGTPLIGEGV